MSVQILLARLCQKECSDSSSDANLTKTIVGTQMQASLVPRPSFSAVGGATPDYVITYRLKKKQKDVHRYKFIIKRQKTVGYFAHVL